MSNDPAGGCEAWSAIRGSFVEPEMSPVFVVIADIFGEDSFEVAFVEGDDMVKQVTPAGTYPTLSNAVLPGALQGGLNANNFHGSNGRGYVEPVLPIVIKYKKLGRRLKGKCFSQLDNPDTGRMASDSPAVEPIRAGASENLQAFLISKTNIDYEQVRSATDFASSAPGL